MEDAAGGTWALEGAQATQELEALARCVGREIAENHAWAMAMRTKGDKT